jgi:hypothetical protein
MTRQPADEKRLTVAWPMPREAPVSTKVLRSELDVVGIRRGPVVLHLFSIL